MHSSMEGMLTEPTAPARHASAAFITLRAVAIPHTTLSSIFFISQMRSSLCLHVSSGHATVASEPSAALRRGSTHINSPTLAAGSTALDAIPNAVFICDNEGRLVHYNIEATRVWGRTPSNESVIAIFSALRFAPGSMPAAIAFFASSHFSRAWLSEM